MCACTHYIMSENYAKPRKKSLIDRANTFVWLYSLVNSSHSQVGSFNQHDYLLLLLLLINEQRDTIIIESLYSLLPSWPDGVMIFGLMVFIHVLLSTL